MSITGLADSKTNRLESTDNVELASITPSESQRAISPPLGVPVLVTTDGSDRASQTAAVSVLSAQIYAASFVSSIHISPGSNAPLPAVPVESSLTLGAEFWPVAMNGVES